MGDFDLTKINNERINIIVTRVRPGKSEIIKNIFHHMGMNLPFITSISPEDDIKLTNTEHNFKSANIEDECMVCYEENKKMYYTSCNRHYICNECSVKLFEKKCPMCRQ
jgi:hypothetical protein